MLLNSVLLCAASEAGDAKEVSRLLNQCGVPVSVCGLRHKAPLHLASASGHAAVVDLLLASGVRLFYKCCAIHTLSSIHNCRTSCPCYALIYITCVTGEIGEGD